MPQALAEEVPQALAEMVLEAEVRTVEVRTVDQRTAEGQTAGQQIVDLQTVEERIAVAQIVEGCDPAERQVFAGVGSVGFAGELIAAEEETGAV